MSTNINLNLNQKPYFEDYDETKDFHQVLYKPAVAVQARELTQEQTILRNQLKRFGDHIFANGSKVLGGDLHLDVQYFYVKLQATYNGTTIDPSLLLGKTIVGNTSGARAVVVNTAVVDSVTGDPDTLWIRKISGDSTTDGVQGVQLTLSNSYTGGFGYTSTPTVDFADPPTGSAYKATGIAVVGASGTIIGINVTDSGSGYTSAPVVTIAGGGYSTLATATSTLGTAAEFVDGERINSTDSTYTSVLAVASSATGRGSAVHNADGYYYFNGNFIRAGEGTLILDKYTYVPTYRIGFQVTASLVSNADDTSLLDNAQGAYNYAAPGADRLKYALTLTKKTTTSTDDTDFIELLKVNGGFKDLEIKYPVYSVLEDTFARRTYDESGSYTVRHFPIQLKNHASDAAKFTVKVDPGKAYNFGHEFETLTSTDVSVNRARTDTRAVNNFDRTLQYGNYTIVKELIGNFDSTANTIVDLHNVAHPSITLTDPTTYASTKIGTAKVRQLNYSSGTAGSTPGGTINYLFKMYLYDVQMTSTDFGQVESIIIPESPLSGTIVLNSKCNIDVSGKALVAGQPNIAGDAKLFETNFNSHVFKLSQNVIKTIRDSAGAIDTSYQIQRTFLNAQVNSGIISLASGGSTEKFQGTGVLSDSVKTAHYHAVIKTVGNSGLVVGDIINFETAASGIGTVAANGQSVTLDTGQASHNYTADVIATINMDTKQEKTKTLVKNAVTAIVAPSGGAQTYTSLNVSDVYAVRAIYDSGNTSNDAIPPKLILTGATGTYIAGETITNAGGTATGTIISHSPLTNISYVATSGTFAATDIITGSANSYTATVATYTVGDTDITSRYTLDNGQRDNFYDHGRIKLTGTAATGRILVVVDYFTHSGNGYFSVDSYTSSGLTDSYVDIPSYTSTTTNETVELRDCVDFRPRRQDGSGNTALQNGEAIYPNSNWQADYEYYLPRTDAVYLSKDNSFAIDTGVSRELPMAPVQKDGAMHLWLLKIPAYTFDTKDIEMVYIENKRYTMRDIAGIEKRVKRIEYYTSLSLLEKDAEALVIPDNAGLDRFKNGILVDPFKGHKVGNVLDPDYKCSIDFENQELRPSFNSNIVDVTYASGSSTGVQLTGDLITLPYTSSAFLTQKQASNAVNVNPFNVLQWIGICDLSPPSDNWVSTNNAPDVLVNKGENDNWEAFGRNLVQGFGTQWNDWETQSSAAELIRTDSRMAPGRIRIDTTTNLVTANQTRSGIQMNFEGMDSIQTSIGDRVRNVSILPYIRAQEITVTIKGMKPNTRVYPFFDGEAIAEFCTPSGGVLGGNIYTDEFGAVSNLLFSLPCPDHALSQTPPLLVFRGGERQFLVTDVTNGDVNTATTFAEAMFQSQGLLQTKENVILSSRVPRISNTNLTGAQTISFTAATQTRTFIPPPPPPRGDPLAQTFYVDSSQYPDGLCLSSMDLYFKTKDENMPVMVDILTTANGFPTAIVVPFSEVIKNPADVSISSDATTATTFTFPSPVYLLPGEYAIRIRANCTGYQCWVAELGQNIVNTTRKISDQAYLGVLFKSQNASTWQQDQNTDLTFVLNRCEFTTAGTHEAVFQNASGQVADYKMDVIDAIPQTVDISSTSIDWSVRTTLQSSGLLNSGYENITADLNHEFDNQMIITTTSGSFFNKAVLGSSSSFVSPIIDTKRNSVIAVENVINNLTTLETELPAGGDADARYITRTVTLADGFDAQDLTVYLSMNRRAGTNVTCYYKVLSQYDVDSFEDKLWKVMQQTSNLNTISTDPEEFVEYQFDPIGADVYYSGGGANFTSYKTFAVKIVMTSSNTTVIPRVKDLRVIALA
jgi:hypothetical protein